jgi:hypothetical protein
MPAGFTVNVTGITAPVGTDAGAPDIATKLSELVIEFTVTVPPPMFCRPSVWETGCELEA